MIKGLKVIVVHHTKLGWTFGDAFNTKDYWKKVLNPNMFFIPKTITLWTFYLEEQIVDSNQTNNLWDKYSLLGLVA